LISAVLTWFNRENFVYTMSPPLLNENTADEFLFDTRSGFANTTPARSSCSCAGREFRRGS
jgi:hypothetical protein